MFPTIPKTLYEFNRMGIYRHFKYGGDNSIWLFITEIKSEEQPQYFDKLNGDILKWQGQNEGEKRGTDDLIINHKDKNLELRIFYRKQEKEYTNHGFRYEGIFEYEYNDNEKPKNFTLIRQNSTLQEEIKNEEGLDLEKFSKEEKAEKLVEVGRKKERIGQAKFREKVLKEYNNTCPVTSCNVPEALEAAHIRRATSGHESMKIQNGFPLRRDIHKLFDDGLITFDNNYQIILSKKLKNSYYKDLNGKKMNLPKNVKSYPDKRVLEFHRKNIAKS